jgi:hypothetical protein
MAKMLSWLSITAWLARLGPPAWYLVSNPPNHLVLYGTVVQNDFKIYAIRGVIWCAVGLALAGCSLVRSRACLWLLAGSSVWFLAYWYFSGAMRLIRN